MDFFYTKNLQSDSWHEGTVVKGVVRISVSYLLFDIVIAVITAI